MTKPATTTPARRPRRPSYEEGAANIEITLLPPTKARRSAVYHHPHRRAQPSFGRRLARAGSSAGSLPTRSRDLTSKKIALASARGRRVRRRRMLKRLGGLRALEVDRAQAMSSPSRRSSYDRIGQQGEERSASRRRPRCRLKAVLSECRSRRPPKIDLVVMRMAHRSKDCRVPNHR